MIVQIMKVCQSENHERDRRLSMYKR